MMRVRIETCFCRAGIVLLCAMLAPVTSRAQSAVPPAKAAAKVSVADNGFTQTGIASWYGGRFHGRRTASGEIFDKNDLTVAHRTLPLGSVVEITNLENGRSAVARINDRGPYVRPRIVDCSQAVASALGFAKDGLASVRVRLLHSLRPHKQAMEDTAPPIATSTTAPRADAAMDQKFCVQLGSFRDPSNAEVLKRRASILPLPVFVNPARALQQVLVGPFSDVDTAAAARRDLRLAGLAGFVRSYETPSDTASETSTASTDATVVPTLPNATP